VPIDFAGTAGGADVVRMAMGDGLSLAIRPMGEWNVAVALRQCPGFLPAGGGVAAFLRRMVREKRFRRGPAVDPRGESLPDSLLV
jgi:hypothetical protein